MEWGGIRLLPFLPCKKMRGGHALKAEFVTEGFPIHHLTGENSSSIASRTCSVGMFKLKAKNNVHHEKESELTKKNVLYQFLPIVPAAKERTSTPIL